MLADSLKIYKIPDKVIDFITEAKINWKVELTTEGKTLAEVKISAGIFQGDSLTPQLFVIAMIPLSYLESAERLQFWKSQEKVDYLMYMDDIKLFFKNAKGLGNLMQTIRIYNQDMGIEFVIEKCVTLIMIWKEN